jgi:hypothetical protein
MEELDQILLEQYHSAKRRLKIIKRHRILLKNDTELDRLEQSVLNTVKYLEGQIRDKRLFEKKPSKRKKTEKSIFCSNPWFEAYKGAFTVTVWSTRLFSEYTQGYINEIAKLWRVKKDKLNKRSDNT